MQKLLNLLCEGFGLSDKVLTEEEKKAQQKVEEELEEYFYDLNNADDDDTNSDVEVKKKKSNVKKLSKQFKAAVRILTHFMSDKKNEYCREDLVKVLERESDGDELGLDAYKHALSFLARAKLITNQVGKDVVSIYWHLNSMLDIHVPAKREDRRRKAQMVISSLDGELSYETFTIAKHILKSQIYNFDISSFYGMNINCNDAIIVCDVEKNPYWKEELEAIKEGDYSSIEEFNLKMYEKTDDSKFLPDTAKDVFVF